MVVVVVVVAVVMVMITMTTTTTHKVHRHLNFTLAVFAGVHAASDSALLQNELTSEVYYSFRSIILTLWMWPRITFISSSPSLTVCKFYFRATRVNRYVRGRIFDTAIDPPQLPTIQLEGSEGVVITCYSFKFREHKEGRFLQIISDISRISRRSFLNNADVRLYPLVLVTQTDGNVTSKRLRWSRGSMLAFGLQVRTQPKPSDFSGRKKSSAYLPSQGK
jgi:hypothetical protein